MSEEKKQTKQKIEFNIQRIFLKDVSFECPNSPAVFKKEWTPQVSMNIDTKHSKLSDNSYDVTLTLTTTAKVNGDVAFLCEVQQAGIFLIDELGPDQMAHCLNAFCPNILFPYAREVISGLVTKGTFPQLNLAPVNFDALFQQALLSRKKQQAEQEAENKATSQANADDLAHTQKGQLDS